MMNVGGVSVVMSVYNAGETLRTAIDSIMQERQIEMELIVVNDGSTDGSSDLLDRYAAEDERVHVHHQENRGLTAALRRGCAEARGTYIARHDSDDFSEPDRFRRQRIILEQEPDLAFVSCWTRFIGPSSEELWVQKKDAASAVSADVVNGRALAEGPTSHGSVMMRRDAYLAAGGYRTEFYFGQDWDLWYRLAERGKFQVVPDILYNARVDPLGISSISRMLQMALGDLSRAATEVRRAGGDEEAILLKAAAIRPLRGKRNGAAAADGLYFIGEMLRQRSDPAARRYLGKAIAARPWMIKAWVRWLQAQLGR